MKVFIVIYGDPYNPIDDIVKVFDSEKKAEEYIETKEYKKHLYIEEKEVE